MINFLKRFFENVWKKFFWLMEKQASIDIDWALCLFSLLQCYIKKLKPNKFFKRF